jgi:hypothetical protein
MIYDLKKHKYVLTEDDVRDELGIELVAFLGEDQQVPIFLKEVSDDLYTWYYSKMLETNIPTVEYLLATTDEYKETIQSALLAQARRMIRSGSHLMKDKIANVQRGITEYKFDDTISDIAKQKMLSLNLISFRPLFFFIPEDAVRGVNY